MTRIDRLPVWGFALAAFCAFGCAAKQAHGAIMYSYVVGSSKFSGLGTTISATPGQVIPINVYIKETLTTPSTSLISSELGMTGAGVKVTTSSSIASPAIISNAVDDSYDFGIEFQKSTGTLVPTSDNSDSVTFSSTVAQIDDAQAGFLASSAPFKLTQGVMLGNSAANTPGADTTVTTPANEVFIGFIDVTAGTSVGATNFSVGEYNTQQGNSITYTNQYDLDATSLNPAYVGAGITLSTFTVNVSNPEPASTALLGVVFTGLVLRRGRQRVV